MVRLALIFSLLGSLAYAKIVDALAAVVNDEPITTYEIQKSATKLHISPDQALELLIQKRLEESQIKKFGIDVNDFELEEAIDDFARKKGMDILSLRQALEAQGIDWQSYKKSFKEQLLRKKLYDKIAQIQQQRISEEVLREYYENHIDEFTVAKRAKLLKYISPSKEILEKILQNPLYRPDNPALLVMDEEELDLDRVNPAFASLINKTPQGSFTPILPLTQDGRYLLILVESKSGLRQIPFEQAKNYIANQMINQNRSKNIKEYFDKLRASAKVTILRMPKGE